MKNLFLSLLILYSVCSRAQIFPCGTVQPPTNDLIISKQYAAILATDNTIRTIPVVFHIVYYDLSDSILFAGGVNNSRIRIQMDVMNECFRKRNADTAATIPQFRGIAADAHIEFCLNEVRFKRTTVTPYFLVDDKMKFLPTGSPAKDPNKYLNVWVCRLNNGTSGVGGYAYFPQSNTVGQPFDGVASHLTYVGNDDRRTGEVTVHEIGHYLNLPHTFGGSCSVDGDFCNDTPISDSPSGGCNTSRINCSHLINNQNWMDYTDCATMFTHDQSARMTATLIGLRNTLWTSGLCSGTPGNKPPTIFISTNGTNFTPPADITISATASDQDGTITRVEFYNGITLLNSDISSPYSFGWTSVVQGVYPISARVFDNGGASGTSNTITVTVSSGGANPPTCVLFQPANNSNYSTTQTIPFDVRATDDGSIIKVEVFWDANLLHVAAPPYMFGWCCASTGTHTTKARCTDNSGLVTTSNINTVTIGTVVNTPPTVSITEPTSGASYTSPASITIKATATDNVSVSKVEFYQGPIKIGTDVTTPYSFAWNMVGVGNYTLTARAYDNVNLSSVSSPVIVTVKAISGDSEVDKIILKGSPQRIINFKAKDGREVNLPY